MSIESRWLVRRRPGGVRRWIRHRYIASTIFRNYTRARGARQFQMTAPDDGVFVLMRSRRRRRGWTALADDAGRACRRRSWTPSALPRRPSYRVAAAGRPSPLIRRYGIASIIFCNYTRARGARQFQMTAPDDGVFVLMRSRRRRRGWTALADDAGRACRRRSWTPSALPRRPSYRVAAAGRPSPLIRRYGPRRCARSGKASRQSFSATIRAREARANSR